MHIRVLFRLVIAVKRRILHIFAHRRIGNRNGDCRRFAVREHQRQLVASARQPAQPVHADGGSGRGLRIVRACGEDCTVTLDFLNFQIVRHGDRNIFAQCREVIQINRYAFRRNSRRHTARERLSACDGGHAVCNRVAGDPHATGKTHAAALDLRLINRAIAGDRRRLAGGHAVDRRIRGGGNRGFGIQLQMIDIRIQRQRNLLIAVYFYIREAFIAWGGQLFLVEHRCAANLCARKTSGACRSNLQQATHRRGHNDVVAHCIRHCYCAAGYDDRTLDVHVIQLYRIRGQTFSQVQIAIDRRVGQRAAFRDGDVRGIALEIGAGIRFSCRRERGSKIIVQDLRQLGTGDDLGRLEGVILVAGDDALVHSRLDVACRPRCNLRLILKRQVCRFYIARISLVQPSEDNRRLLTGNIPLRIHPAAAGAVNVAVLLGNAHRVVVPRVGLHIAVRNACLLREVKRTVDIAHELRTSDLALRLVLAGGRTRIDDALIIQIFDKVFAPVSVQIGGKRCRYHRCQHRCTQESR